MTLRSSLLLAIRYLFGNRSVVGKNRRVRRLRGGVIGVAVSLVPLVIVLQVADGMIAGIAARFIETGSYHLQAIARAQPSESEILGVVNLVRAVPGVEVATPERQGLGLVASGHGRSGITLRAVAPDLWDVDDPLREYVRFSSGSWDLSDERSVLLGENVARALSVSAGDTVQILTARTGSGGRFLPRSTTVTVRGVFSTGYQDLDRLWAFVPFSLGMRLIPDSTARQIVGVKVDDPLAIPNPLFRTQMLFARSSARTEEAIATIDAIESELGSDWRVASWFDLERAKYMSFQTTKNLLLFIMVLIVIVAAVNISSALVMLVLEKQEEIAILKGLGASPGGIRAAFLFAGFVLGAIGSSVGIGAGLLLAVNINEILYGVEWLLNAGRQVVSWLAEPFAEMANTHISLLSSDFYLETIPITIRVQDLLLVGVLTLSLATLAALFPASRAARLRPVEILRRN